MDAGCADQIEISGIRIEHTARVVGHEDAVERPIDHGFQQWIALIPAGKSHDAGGRGKQREYADGSKHRQQSQNVGFHVIAADIDQTASGRDQDRGNRQHQTN